MQIHGSYIIYALVDPKNSLHTTVNIFMIF